MGMRYCKHCEPIIDLGNDKVFVPLATGLHHNLFDIETINEFVAQLTAAYKTKNEN